MSFGIYNGEIVEIKVEGEDVKEVIVGIIDFMIFEGLG